MRWLEGRMSDGKLRDVVTSKKKEREGNDKGLNTSRRKRGDENNKKRKHNGQ